MPDLPQLRESPPRTDSHVLYLPSVLLGAAMLQEGRAGVVGVADAPQCIAAAHAVVNRVGPCPLGFEKASGVHLMEISRKFFETWKTRFRTKRVSNINTF